MGIVDNTEGNKKLIYITTRYKEEEKRSFQNIRNKLFKQSGPGRLC